MLLPEFGSAARNCSTEQKEAAMLDHVGYPVSDLKKSRIFYENALAPLGLKVIMEVTAEMTGGSEHLGFGDAFPGFWIGTGKIAGSGVHIAFKAKSRAAVDEFHAAALAAGGRDNGPPGVRAHYHKDYYGAFVLDPDGNNVEAVCHTPD
jgi:catechol 2,3-dioxygenase-like lactoylglutathione lyase family enzyme